MKLLLLFCIFGYISAAENKNSKTLSDVTDWLNSMLDRDNSISSDNGKTDTKFGTTSPPTKEELNFDPTPIDSNKNKKCKTDKGEDGLCVKSSKCENTEQQIVDAATSFTLREGQQCHYLTPCCPMQNVKNETVTIKPSGDNSSKGCGWSNPGANVFRGKSNEGYADYGEFPWMVALLKKSIQNNKWEDQFLGGGAMINPSVVLTVAHKVDEVEKKDIKCRAGEWDTRTENELWEHQERDVANIIIHDEYIRLHARNDIALLLLRRPFVLRNAPHMGLGCIGKSLPPAGTVCYGMGWGQDFNNNNAYAVVLKKIKLPLVEGNTCQNNLRNTKLGSKYFLHSSLMCAGGEAGIDTCMGDGGSPLVCAIGNSRGERPRYAIYGLTAYGVSCGKADEPGVYVNVPEFYDWITQKLAMEQIDTSSYVY